MQPRAYALSFVALTLGYWAMAIVGLRWSVVPGAGTAIWPASGVAFAVLLLVSLKLWPAVVLGRMLAFATVGSPLPLWAELLVSLGTTAAAVLPAWLLKRRGGLDPSLGNVRDMLWLVVGGATVGAFISASGGVLALLVAGTRFDVAWNAGLSWYFGYGVGLLIVGPLLLTWWARSGSIRRPSAWLHFAFCMGVNAAAAAYLFLQPPDPHVRIWLLFPLLVWAAVSFQVRGAASALLLVSLFAIGAAVTGTGPLSLGEATVQFRTLLTQQFIGMIGATILLLAAAVDERRNVEAAARLAAIVHSSPEAMLSFDASGAIRSWNKGAEQLFGYQAEEVLGRNGEFLMPNEQPEGPDGVFGMAQRGRQPIYVETQRLSKDGVRLDVAVSASPMLDPGGAFLGVAAIMRDIRDRKKAERHQQLLIGELNHRVKNTLAIVQSLAQQTFKDVSGGAAARAAFEGRLLALAAAHNVLTERSWENAEFREIVQAALRPFQPVDGGERVTMVGPNFIVSPQTAVSFAMVIHELATNAVKYGGLRPGGGHLTLEWTIEGEKGFELTWSERNPEPITARTRPSFGTKLIERTLKAEIGADVVMSYAPEGLQVRIRAPHFGRAKSGSALPFPLRAEHAT